MTRKQIRPLIIQGGMGAGISNWRLARAVSSKGQLGVISGTAIDVILARRLQDGDPCGHMRRALAQFPIPAVAQRILERYFLPDGRAEGAAYRSTPMPSADPGDAHLDLTIAGGFVEVFLAKEGHEGIVGVNLLEKIQAPNLATLYGTMLAGVDVVLMGAGIPTAIPGALDQLAKNETAILQLDLEEAPQGTTYMMRLDPVEYASKRRATLDPPSRPDFFAIISSDTLASAILRRAKGRVDGFVVENCTAGGHNASPRRSTTLNARGEPVYGPRDEAKLDVMRRLDRPFWIAGTQATPGALRHALDLGATGIQVGTAFAMCEESGLLPSIKNEIIQKVRNKTINVFTDPLASPSGFPFKVVVLDGTISDDRAYHERRRCCDLGYFRKAYIREDGSLGWRCPAEALDAYARKGGDLEDTVGRKCVCNALLATMGLPQHRPDDTVELPIVTAGENVSQVARFLKPGSNSYTADDVLNELLADAEVQPPASTALPPEVTVVGPPVSPQQKMSI